jgi:hypothetical protein
MIFHLGYPKCASTKLQLEFANSDCMYLGCNPKNEIGNFYDKNIGTFFDSIFRFGTDTQFKQYYERIAKILNQLNQIQQNKLVLSLESSIKRIVPFDLPTDIKIQRLGKVLPKGTTFVILHRPIKEHLFSQYRDFINCGYAYSFKDFISEMNLIWDYGFVSDLCLNSIFKLITHTFPDSRILLADIKKPNFLSKVFRFLNLSSNISKNKINEGILIDSYRNHLEFNQSQLNQKSFLDMIEVHRVFPYGNIDDNFKFKYARMRNIHKKLDLDQNPFKNSSITNIKWPDYINRLDEDNNIFLSNKKMLSNLIIV